MSTTLAQGRRFLEEMEGEEKPARTHVPHLNVGPCESKMDMSGIEPDPSRRCTNAKRA